MSHDKSPMPEKQQHASTDGTAQDVTAVVEPAASLPSSHALPMDPLCLSILSWSDDGMGRPLVWTVDDSNGPEPYGTYRDAIPPSTHLLPTSWSEDHEAFVYQLSSSNRSFTYKRSTHVGVHIAKNVVWPLGGIFGDASVQDPLLFIHRPLPPAVPSAFRSTLVYDSSVKDKERKERTTPPFVFTADAHEEQYIDGSVASRAALVRLTMPDLEMHRAAEYDGHGAESSEEDLEEEELKQGLVMIAGEWRGNWSRTFIAHARAGQPLAHLDKVIWDDQSVWGLKVRLTPIANSIRAGRVPFPDREDSERGEEGELRFVERKGKLRLRLYKIQATIQEVYVKPIFFEEVEEH